MAIKIGNLNINSFKVGSDDCKIYLGDTLLYPTTPPTPSFDGKWKATYQDGHVESAQCDSWSAIRKDDINKENLVSIEIGDCITSIGDAAFRDYSSLTSVNIPNSVTSIGTQAFQNCSSLTSITIPNSVTSIGASAFATCSGLTSVSIGNSVTSIGTYAFNSCSRLTNIVIPNSVTSIVSNAFRDCSGLTSVSIGNGVTNIQIRAFYQCVSLQSITINATTPPTLGTSVFNNTNNCPIYVPSASLTDYQTASGWSTYASRIQAIPNS